MAKFNTLYLHARTKSPDVDKCDHVDVGWMVEELVECQRRNVVVT